MREKLLTILCVIVVFALSGCCSGFTDLPEPEPEPDPSASVTPDPNAVATPTPTPTADPNAVAAPGQIPSVPTPQMPQMPQMPAGGNMLAVNVPVQGTFAPGLPTDGDGKPYIDYILNVATPGNYMINLISTNTMSYDPYIILLQNGMEINHDDDGGGNLQSRLSTPLGPGMYIVRVTKFGSGQISMPVVFSLTVSQF